MKRRRLLVACGGVTGTLAGCISDGSPDDSSDDGGTEESTDRPDPGDPAELPDGITEEQLTSCEEEFISSERDYGSNWGGIHVRSVDATEEGVRAKVTSEWGKETSGERRFRFSPGPDEVDEVVPSSSDDPFDVSALQRAIADAAEGEKVEVHDGNSDFAVIESALNEAYDGVFDGEDDAVKYVEHEGEIVAIEYSYEPPLAKDYWVTAYYHVVDGEIYPTEDDD